ncbi:MAG: helix-turn-helix transcriptional regulator [Clostridia bacterium]|nr:helix-turn-helix transcriptional regulator [Clostridia bacterium]
MGKKSVRENKNIYQQYREEAGLTMDKASENMEVVSVSRIEKIESGKSLPYPEEVLSMAGCYKAPDLCNYYCSNECAIGKIYVPETKDKDLANIVLEVIATLNTLETHKNRLIEIAADGKVAEDELKDFDFIKAELEKVSGSVDSLKLWLEKNKVE